MSCNRAGGGVVVELVGTPGAGKTTLTAELVRSLRARGIAADTIVSAARAHALRTPVGAVVGCLPESRARRTLLWYVFYAASLGHALDVARQQPALTDHVLRAQQASGGFARDARAAFWFAHLVGRLHFLAATARPGEVLVVVDGFLHRAVHLHASPFDAPDLRQVRDYVDLVPVSDLAVHTIVRTETCRERVRARGIWAHAADLDDDELGRYLEHADVVASAAVGRARDDGWNVLTVFNEHRLPRDVAGVLEAEVARLVAEPSTSDRVGKVRVPRVPRPSRVKAQVAARLGRPVLARDQVDAVLAHYDLAVAPGSRRDLRLGRRSANVVLPTDRGIKVVKRYRPQWSPATVACGHSILEELEAREFPAVRLTRTAAGASSVVVDGRIFALFDFAPGTSYSLHYLRRADRLELTATAGRTLARFHEQLARFTSAGEHHLGFVAGSALRHRDLDWHSAKVDELAGRSAALRGDAAAPAATLVTRADDVLQRIAGLERELAAVSLPRLVIHGDYGLHNLLFRSTTDAVVVDFENARIDWRINDLISVVGKHRYQRDHSYDLEAMATLLRAYSETFPLDDAEAEALPDAWRLYKLRAAVQYWNSYFETGGPTRKLWSALDAIEQSELPDREPQMLRQLARIGRGSVVPTRRAS